MKSVQERMKALQEKREQRAKELFRDYWNNYITVAAFAAGNLLTIRQAEKAIELGREIHNKEAIGGIKQ